MPNVQKISIEIPEERFRAVQIAVETGEYGSASQIVSEALLEWQYRREIPDEELRRLRSLWVEGMRSGVATEVDMEQFLLEARRKLKEASPQLI